MPTPGAYLTGLSHLGFAIEATAGTPVSATAWAPVMKFTPQDLPKYIPDTGARGTATRDYGQYLGTKEATYDIEGDAFPDSFGNMLAAVWGTDTVSGTTTYTHTFTVADAAPSYTISDFYVAGARQFPGAKCEKLAIKFTPEAGVTYTANFIGWPSVIYTAETTTTFETEPFLLGWEGAISLAGTADKRLSNFTLTLSRDKSKVLFSSQNSQDPYYVFQGLAVAEWEAEYYMTDDSEYTPALTQGTQAVVATITQSGTSNVLTCTSSAVQWTKPTIDRGGEYVVVKVTGDGIYNSTDAGPAQVTLVNSIATSYSTAAAA